VHDGRFLRSSGASSTLVAVRRRRVIPQIVSVAAAAALVASAPAPACGCGVALESTVASERALIVHEKGREQLVTSFDLVARGKQPAVVLPVPGRPTVRSVRDPFEYLEAATRPRVVTVEQPGGGGGDGAAAGTPEVDVIDRETIGGFDVTRIAGASDPRALSRWLDRNGYEMPKAAAPILADYAGQGWSFVALRLAKGGSGRLKPLSVAFDSKEPIYPMLLDKLARDQVAVDLWFLTAGRVQVDGLDDRYAGPVAELTPKVPERLASLLDGPYLSRVAGTVDPATIRADFVAVRAAADSPYRATFEHVVYTDEASSSWLEDNLLLVLLGAAVLLAALGFGVRALRSRGATRPGGRG
jgi:hypothetical protein